MIKELVKGYNSLKIKLATKLGEGHEGIRDELEFLDDSIIASKINHIKKICAIIDQDMAHATDEDIKYLLKEKQEYIFEIAFLASNSAKNIDFCLNIIDKNNDFVNCLKAIKLVEEGKNKEAKVLFDNYFKTNKYLLEHYLISKMYGKLLLEAGDLYNAALFLRKAIEKRPDEIEIHKMLEYIYLQIGEEILLANEREIISMLQ